MAIPSLSSASCWLGSALVLAVGCGGDGGEPAVGFGRGGLPCGLPFDLRPSVAASVIGDGRGTLIGGALHLELQLAEGPRHAVLALDGDTAELRDAREDLLGGAVWTPVGDGRWVRVHGQRIDVLDAADPLHPILDEPVVLHADAWSKQTGVVGEGVFLCMAPDDADYRLYRVDLEHPETQPEMTESGSDPCGAWSAYRVAAAGTLWAAWSPNRVELSDLADPSGSSPVTHVHDPRGAEQYGELLDLATDGTRVAATMENHRYLLVHDRGRPEAGFVYAPIGHEPVRLLAVIDGLAVVSGAVGPTAVYAYDIRNPAKVTRTSMRAAIPGMGPASLVAHDHARIVVRNNFHDPELYVVPLGAVGQAAPLHIVEPLPAGTCP